MLQINNGVVVATNYILHFLTDSLAIGFGDFGSGEGFIHLSNIVCAGTEERLFDCGGSPVGQHLCVHSEDAGIICEGKY